MQAKTSIQQCPVSENTKTVFYNYNWFLILFTHCTWFIFILVLWTRKVLCGIFYVPYINFHSFIIVHSFLSTGCFNIFSSHSLIIIFIFLSKNNLPFFFYILHFHVPAVHVQSSIESVRCETTFCLFSRSSKQYGKCQTWNNFAILCVCFPGAVSSVESVRCETTVHYLVFVFQEQQAVLTVLDVKQLCLLCACFSGAINSTESVARETTLLYFALVFQEQ